MHKRTKLWSSLSLAALVGGSAVSQAAEDERLLLAASAVDAGQAVAAAGSEGEGEGEGAVAQDPATNDVAYLTQLGLMRGHLLVGLELYRQGHIEHARTHMKHPKSELYANLQPAFDTRKAAGFARQLEALAAAVEGDDSERASVEAAYEAVLAGIGQAESHTAKLPPAARLQVAVNLVRTAADEYGIGVVEAKVVNAHEYQDAYGFTNVAQDMVGQMDAAGDAGLADTLAQVRGLIQSLFDANAWPAIMPPDTVGVDASLLYGAAARIEIVALGLY
ncbi:MAG: hypothetical protein ACK5HY_05290 [Parahaliea sp.]